jgi:hypothetical protein
MAIHSSLPAGLGLIGCTFGAASFFAGSEAMFGGTRWFADKRFSGGV